MEDILYKLNYDLLFRKKVGGERKYRARDSATLNRFW